MYSWMKGYCSSYLQYKYSRYLFMKCLYSREIINTFGVSFSNNVAMFVRKHVLPHEKTFLNCLRKNIRHYGEYSNTPLEGTNNGLKHSSISTHPGFQKCHWRVEEYFYDFGLYWYMYQIHGTFKCSKNRYFNHVLHLTNVAKLSHKTLITGKHSCWRFSYIFSIKSLIIDKDHDKSMMFLHSTLLPNQRFCDL